MSSSKCPSCSNSSFELKEINVKDSRYKLYAIQCSSCGAVVSITEYYNVGNLIEEQTKLIKSLKQDIDTVNQNIISVANALSKIIK